MLQPWIFQQHVPALCMELSQQNNSSTMMFINIFWLWASRNYQKSPTGKTAIRLSFSVTEREPPSLGKYPKEEGFCPLNWGLMGLAASTCSKMKKIICR